jgi:hypothetical protein
VEDKYSAMSPVPLYKIINLHTCLTLSHNITRAFSTHLNITSTYSLCRTLHRTLGLTPGRCLTTTPPKSLPALVCHVDAPLACWKFLLTL